MDNSLIIGKSISMNNSISSKKENQENTMRLRFSDYHPHSFVKQLAKQLQINSEQDCLEQFIELTGKQGSGKITGFMFSDGVAFLLFDCILNKDWELRFVKNSNPPLQFNFDIEGEIWHNFNDDMIRYHLNPLQGSITACPKNSEQVLKLPGKRKILFASLLIDRSKYIDKIECMIDKMPPALSEIFTDFKAKKSFFYQGNYSITAAKCIKKITNDEHVGLVRSTNIEGKALALLSRQVRQFQDDLLRPGKQVMLRKYDIEKIKYARDILVKDIKNPPTIKLLAKKAGVNQQKLKSGFKTIFDKTINQYLTEKRLELAAILLLKELSIKEAAVEVGYANFGYFSKKFKNKYGVLPKEYLKSIQLRISESN